MSLLFIYFAFGWVIRAAMVPIVLRRQFAPGASLGWLGIVSLHPYLGVALYMLVGESRLGPRRAQRHRDIIEDSRDPARYPNRKQHETKPDPGAPYQPMIIQAEKISGLPVLSDNDMQFFTDTDRFVDDLIQAIASARKEVNLLYYIFAEDASAERVTNAMLNAAGRGVRCRLLADAIASRKIFRTNGLASELVAGGVQVAMALPVAPIRRRFARMDLRNHRKLAIIDGQTAFVGSHNLINADYGGRRGNPWHDLTAKFHGPIVGELAAVFAEDWAFENGEELEVVYPDSSTLPSGENQAGGVVAQAVPTGPSTPAASYRRLLLAAIQTSRRQLIITTPYFVPDEPTLLALVMAADRGVDVKLILPKRPDHFFTAAAGRAHFQMLLDAGLRIYLYEPGLIHSKTTTVDDAFALFGSANLDVRSFSLNFELSLLLYGPDSTNRLRAIQNEYLQQSSPVDPAKWAKRNVVSVYTDRAISLLSPLL
ncbi:MAG: cardiolipin synthase [Planctomycetota bacterium]|nr:cardiolipin synthase [Planctomycetota bacterium]